MRLCWLAALSLLIGGSLHAQGVPDVEIQPQRLRAHVDFLADDLLGGRDTGQAGYDISARYVASQFTSFGLEPAVQGSWLQPVPFVRAQLASGSVTVGGQSFPNEDGVLLRASTQYPADSIDAPVVFAGYGIDYPPEGLDDYRGLDVRGKWVAVLRGVPKSYTGDRAAHLTNQKARMAYRHGAIGVITLLSPEDLQRPWEQFVRSSRRPQLSWLDKEGRPFARAPGLRAAPEFGPKAAEALFAGAPKPLSEVFAEAARGKRPRGFPLRQNVKVEQKSRSERITSPNIIGLLRGADPILSREYVLVMAHLDGHGIDPQAKGDQILNGAVDNAAGVAVMLEVARALAASPVRPKRSILFAAVTAEERGLLGSQYLANNPIVGDGRIVGVVSLDTPLLVYDFKDVAGLGAEHSTLGETLARAAARMNIAVSADPMPEHGLFARSDHYSFVMTGIPSTMLITGFANGGQEAWHNYLGTHYHQGSDESDQAFDWAAAARFTALHHLVVRDIANAPEAPRWHMDSFFGKAVAADKAAVARSAR